jgi:heme-degrading monooxygenase HmoA
VIAILWTYKVRARARQAFERAYGPSGDWSQLFGRAEGYLGTELLRGSDDNYLTIDRWRAEADFEAFLAGWGAEYAALDRRAGRWTIEERKLGMWSVR